ncbi:MAG: M23 family metallopeptidase [Clostridia bacterium]|nr:M23 family metallopeptidase [Clostridia bacterium]
MVLSPFESQKYRVTSPYGKRVLNGATQFHGGVDLVGIGGTAVCSVCDGTVVSSQIITDKNNLTWQWGNYVAVRGSDGAVIYYCHLASRAVKKGDKVKKGQRIGIMGNTGYSFGAHLHFEVRRNNKAIDAAEYLGIPNKTGQYNVRILNAESYIDGIIEKAKFSKPDDVKKALLGVKHNCPDDLFRKIYEKMI